MFKEVIGTNLLIAVDMEIPNEISGNHIPKVQNFSENLRIKNFLNLIFIGNTTSPIKNNSAEKIRFCYEKVVKLIFGNRNGYKLIQMKIFVKKN